MVQMIFKVLSSAVMASKIEWERQSWGLWEHLRFIAIVLLWLTAWIAKALLVLLPQHLPMLGIMDSASKSEERRVRMWSSQGGGALAKTAIGRALSQVLELVNDIPASSRKYEFARSLADKMICDNSQHGCEALKEVNRMSLEAGFARTAHLLGTCIEGIHKQRQVEVWGWPWRLARGVSQGAATLSCQLVPGLANLKEQLMDSPSAEFEVDNLEAVEMAEKLSQELLWLAQRLKDNAALQVAISHWTSASALAKQCLYANPRVQRLLVKLSAFLCAGLVSSDVEASREVLLKMLLLWLPLFCRSNHGIDAQVFTSSEKQEAERVLERTIHLLPDADQELVLSLWLGEFVMSSSDWPNLQACYNNWCHSTRKLNFAPPADPCRIDAEVVEKVA